MPSIPIPQAFALAAQHHQAGRLAEAEMIYRQILTAQPNHADALHFLGVLWHHAGRSERAVELIRQAIALAPNNAAAYSNLGEAYRALRRFDEAADAYRLALQLDPTLADAHNNLAIFMGWNGRFGEAVAGYRRALELRPEYAEAANNLGTALLEMAQLAEAEAAIRRALALRPDYDDAKFNLGFIRLLRDDFESGWPLYESRREVFQASALKLGRPVWQGEPIQGRRILVYPEQGFGDAIQFVRYAALFAERGAEVIVGCQPELTELLRTAKGVCEVVAAGEKLPPFDFYIPMLSQPMAFQTKRESIPSNIPYLFANPDRVAVWRQRLGDRKGRRRIGLTWTGAPTNHRNRTRMIPLKKLAPLLSLEDVEFYSLQLGWGSEQLQQAPEARAIIDHTAQIQNFADTAAFIMELDLIISVDTAVAHLAGALGKPVWTLLQFVPDWRWHMEGEQTPWYPTMRLFRPPALLDWDSVVQRVLAELRQLP
jgi:Flp pilus assembly protein TadD